MGWPISQSRSPMLHNFWFAQHGLAGSYVPMAIPPERLEAALRALPALNFRLQPDHPAQAGCDADRRRGRHHGEEDRRDLLRGGAQGRLAVGLQQRLVRLHPQHPGVRAGLARRRRARRGDGRGRRLARRGLWPDGARRPRDPAVQPHACAGADAGEGVRRADHGAAVGAAPRRHRRRRDAGQRHEPGHDRPGGARSAPRQAAEVGAGQRHHLHPARDAADRGRRRAATAR